MTATPETAEEDLKALEASDLPLTELGIARRLVATYGASIRHSPELRCWLVWDGVTWGDDIAGEVTRKAKEIIDRLHGEARLTRGRSELTKAWLRFQSAAVSGPSWNPHRPSQGSRSSPRTSTSTRGRSTSSTGPSI